MNPHAIFGGIVLPIIANLFQLAHVPQQTLCVGLVL